MEAGDRQPRDKWVLTQGDFDAFLARLGADRDSAGARYVELRRNLIRFFEWRGCPFPEDHADEAFNRVVRRLSGGEEIRDPAAYVLGAARMLVLEIQKEQVRERHSLGNLTDVANQFEPEDLEPRVACLERCLSTLSPDNREFILEYYQGDKGEKIANRKRLTERLQVSINTLRMRALRLRETLQSCVEACMLHP